MTPAIEIRPCRQIQINGYCYHPSLPPTLSTDHGAQEGDSHKPQPFRFGKWMRQWQRRAHL